MSALLQDLRYALRGLSRSPAFTAVAVLTLALGVGANTAIFSVVNAVLVRPIPGLADPGRLVWVTHTEEGRPRRVSYPDFLDDRDHSGVFAGIAALDQTPVHVSGSGEAERVEAQFASGDFFSVLGVVPALGRGFTADDERARRPLAMISWAYWQKRFQGDPRAVGSTLVVNGRPWTVVGVAPAHFVGLDIEKLPALFLPLETWLDSSGRGEELGSRGSSHFRVIARLSPGVGRAQAAATVAAIARRAAPERPKFVKDLAATVEPLRGWVPPGHMGEMLPMAAVGLAATGLVLLIASANVASLLVGRAARRRREIGIRVALGASRGRVLRQLLTESVVLAGLGALAGVLFATWSLDLLLSRFDVPAGLQATLDGHVLAYALGAAVATGLLFGLAPAWNATRPSVLPALREGSGGSDGSGRSRLQAALVVVQVALSLLLLACAGLFLRSLGKAAVAPVGFDRASAEAVAALSFDLQTQGYSAESALVFERELLARAATLPGTRGAALAQTLPLGNRAIGDSLAPEGTQPDEGEGGVVFLNNVSPGFFATIGIPLVAGRDFTGEDRPGSPEVAIVNESLARRFWPGQSPIGKRLVSGASHSQTFEVVGVARDGKYLSLTEESRPFAYFPILQGGARYDETILLVRGSTGLSVAPDVRALVRTLDPALPVFQARTLADALAQNMADRRQGTLLVAAFGVLALALAAVGLYGVIAFAVGERRREIGIRMALGASHRDVVGLFVGRGARLAGVGVAIGLVLAAAVTRVLSSFLFGVTPMDVTTLGGVSLLLLGVAIVASGFPARRAAAIDPAIALRQD